jgi:tetratricopeptide (TPR) repeat protein
MICQRISLVVDAVCPAAARRLAALALFASFWAGWPSATHAQVTPETLIGGAVSDAGPYYQDLSDAIARLRTGDLDGARTLFNAARKKAPKLSPPELMLANALMALNQGALARNELEKAVQQYPQDPEPYVRLAEFNASEGRTTESELLFAKGIEVAEKFDESPKRKRLVQLRAYSTAAALDEAREHWQPALDKLQSLAKLDPDTAAVHQRLAKVYFKLGKPDDAFRELQAVDAMNTKPGLLAELTMAAFCNAAADRLNAEKWVDNAIQRGAASLAAQVGLANWYLENNDAKLALEHAEAALKLDPQSPEAKLARGNVARLQQDWKTAETMLASAHLLAPTNSEIINHLALVLIEKTDEVSRQRAVDFADLNVRLNPASSVAAGSLGWIQFRMGKLAEADRLMTLITSNNQQVTNDVAYFVACVRKDQGRVAEAERLLEEVMSHDNAFHYRKQAQDMLQQLGKGTPKTAVAGKSTTATDKPKKRPAPKAAPSE